MLRLQNANVLISDKIKRNKDSSQDFVFVQASMAMWLLLTHPVQFCILSIIINLGVDNHTNEK